MAGYPAGTWVLAGGDEGYVEASKPDDPFDVRVYVIARGYSSSYAACNVKPIE